MKQRVFCSLLLAQVAVLAVTPDSWYTRLSPAMTSEERNAYRKMSSEAERQGFRQAFWNGKAMSENQYLERVSHADQVFGSGREGSGANTDQGRMYIASGPPSAIHRLPSSRTFVACEVWQYDSLQGTGYRSRLQFLFYKKAAVGDFRLYWPGLHSIRDLLIPQPGTRSMFPVNDTVTANDIRDRLRYSPGEEEIVDASVGVAKGITGSGNGEILARATSISAMLRYGQGSRPAVATRFAVADAPEIRAIHFWSGETPVTDLQVRATASDKITISVTQVGGSKARLENTILPLGLPRPKAVLFTQRFFLPPGKYQVRVEIDGRFGGSVLEVPVERNIKGEAIDGQPGDLKISMLPDADSDEAKAIVSSRIP